ncbi:MAG: DUF5596 domain-containing protein [Clostridia bacterium]|nr:DUF5596 domain-containing protein [Clostridia bacterium]
MIVDNRLLREWYTRLHFPSRYDEAFAALLGTTATAVNEEFGDTAQANVLTALYRCEQLKQDYARLGLPEQVLLDTLSDVVIWTDTWYSMHEEFGLMEIGWLQHHFSAKLFRLGRLQFCMGTAHHAIPEAGLAEGDPVMEVHIPSGGAMRLEDCKASIAAARTFFAEYFPAFRYETFTCHSWLLDKTLTQFLNEGSNILQFQTLFTVAQNDRSDAILKYIFRWDATRDTLDRFEPQSKLAAAVKPFAQNGGVLYESLGWFK